jgi:hypothetical protein
MICSSLKRVRFIVVRPLSRQTLLQNRGNFSRQVISSADVRFFSQTVLTIGRGPHPHVPARILRRMRRKPRKLVLRKPKTRSLI